MTLTDQVVKNIITLLIKSQDHRMEVVALLNAEFLQFTIDFFKKVIDAKLQNKNITADWYKEVFLNPKLPPKEIAINSGLNTKTITNMFKSARREIVLDASNEHYDLLYKSIQSLVETETELELTLTIKFKNVSVDLSVSESLIVINTLAVKRAEFHGGLWSTAGKRVEKYLMRTLCELYQVPESYYDASHFVKDKGKNVDREVDFYLLNNGKQYLCEVKLTGKGNPESADATFARKTNIFIADTLSQQNKNQADELSINWVALSEEKGYKKFGEILQKLNIPHTDYNGDLEEDLPKILEGLF